MSYLNKIYFRSKCEHTWSTIYLYAWRSKRSISWMLRDIHALMIVVKSKCNWTVRCMCSLRLKCSCAYMFTCFVDLVLTYVLALMIICSHVSWLIWSHAVMFTSYEIHKLLCSHVLIIVCSYVNMVWKELVHFPICLNAHMLGHFIDWMLLC